MGIQRKSSSKDSVVLQCAEIALIKQMAPLVVYVAVKSSSKCSVHCNASEEQGGNLKKKKKKEMHAKSSTVFIQVLHTSSIQSRTESVKGFIRSLYSL